MQSSEYFVKTRLNTDICALSNFLNDGRIRTPKGDKYTIIINQEIGGTYILNFEDDHYDAKEYDLINPNNGYVVKENIIEFFKLLETIRISGVVMKFAEKQVFDIALIPKLAVGEKPTIDVFGDAMRDMVANAAASESLNSSSVGSHWGEDSDTGAGTKSYGPGQDHDTIASNKYKTETVDNSCIWLDFDIYQRSNKRHFESAQYQNLVQEIAEKIIKPNAIIPSEGLKFHATVFRKKNLRQEDDKTGRWFKDSFHLRIFLRTSKNFKIFLVKAFNESSIITDILSMDVDDIKKEFRSLVFLDEASARNPAMFLGSCKASANEASEFHVLFHCVLRDSCRVNEAPDFDPIKPESHIVTMSELKAMKVADRNKIINTGAAAEVSSGGSVRFKYNLCLETSLNFEAPEGGLIKKSKLVLRTGLEMMINVTAERNSHGILSRYELDDVMRQVNDLCVTDYEAMLVKNSLDMLSSWRAQDYQSWKSIICILARTSIDYKSLAIYFSQRCPEKWNNNGAKTLDSLWDWARTHTTAVDDDDDGSRVGIKTVRTIHWMARTDSPQEYFASQERNAHVILCNAAIEHGGQLTENYLAKSLQIMYGMKFVCDEDSAAGGRGGTIERTWYEFVYPRDDSSEEASHYKWRRERHPDMLDKYISDSFYKVLDKVRQYVESRAKDRAANADENQQKYYESVSKELKKVITKLGTSSFIRKILDRCLLHFRRRNFCEKLDKEGTIIGVSNGVLKLIPKTELIQNYHEYLVSRSIAVPYHDGNFNPETVEGHRNKYVRKLWQAIKRLFGGRSVADQMEVLTFVMCYLAASLDGRRKRPFFFLWLGEGSNGKSFLLELHINTLQFVMNRPHGGYAAKINSTYFMQATKASGPDSEKMSLKHARFAYCSESDRGAELIMSKIKEFTSETLTGSEKFKTQEMFEAICLFVFCSNYDPRIQGRDYGTWRRILAFYFRMRFVDNPDPKNPCEAQLDLRLEDAKKDRNYQAAYFEILVYFYGLLRDKYDNDLMKVPHKVIIRDTAIYQDQQDDLSRFITEHLQHVIPDDKQIELPISDVVSAYRRHNKGQFGMSNNITLISDFEKHERLKPHIGRRNGATFLINFEYIEQKINQPNPEPLESTPAPIINTVDEDIDGLIDDMSTNILLEQIEHTNESSNVEHTNAQQTSDPVACSSSANAFKDVIDSISGEEEFF